MSLACLNLAFAEYTLHVEQSFITSAITFLLYKVIF